MGKRTHLQQTENMVEVQKYKLNFTHKIGCNIIY